MQIYIGNLPAECTDTELRSMFEAFGTVRTAVIGEEKGYGLVEMPVKSEGREAIEALRGKEMDGKPLRVRALKPGDEFHDYARGNRGGHGHLSGAQFRGNIGPRAGGAIRRGGKRGA